MNEQLILDAAVAPIEAGLGKLRAKPEIAEIPTVCPGLEEHGG